MSNMTVEDLLGVSPQTAATPTVANPPALVFDAPASTPVKAPAPEAAPTGLLDLSIPEMQVASQVQQADVDTGERPYVVSIKGNVKGESAFDLGQHTVIYGPNGSGKSAVVNMIELAYTGRASDVAGRAAVSKGEVIQALSGDGASVWSQATLSDGRTANFRADKGKRAQRDGAEGMFLGRTVIDQLTGSAKGAREFLLRHACGGLTKDAIRHQLAEEQRPLYDRLAAMSGAKDGVELLQEVVKSSAAQLKQAKSKQKMLEDRMKELGVPEAPKADPARFQRAVQQARQDLEFAIKSEAELQARRKAETQYGSRQDLVNKYTAAATEHKRITEEVARLETAIERTRAALAKARKSSVISGEQFKLLSALRGGMEILGRRVAKKKNLLTGEVDGDVECSFCGTHVEGKTLDQRVTSVLAAVNSQLNGQGNPNAVPDGFPPDILEKQKMAEKGLADRRNRLRGLKAQMEAWEPTVRMAHTTEVSDEMIESAVETINNARESLAASETSWQRLVEQKAKFDAYDVVRNDLDQTNKLVIRLTAIHDTLAALVAKFVDGGIDNFNRRVSNFLPDGDKFGIRLTKTSAYLGLYKDGKLCVALSGAEWARVVAAVGSAVATELAKDSPAAVVLPDRAWDPKSLRSAMESLGRTDVQVIVTSTIKPFRGFPKNWKVIDLYAAEA